VLDQTDWYCTNRPEIESAVNLPDILSHERKRRLEVVEKARRTEAGICAAADREAAQLQAAFDRILDGLRAEIDEINEEGKLSGYRSQNYSQMLAEQRRERVEAIHARADEVKARHAQSMRNLVIKTGKDIEKVRLGMAAELPPLPPPVIPVVTGPFGRPYGEPPIGVQR
jgi:hypothetical protein